MRLDTGLQQGPYNWNPARARKRTYTPQEIHCKSTPLWWRGIFLLGNSQPAFSKPQLPQKQQKEKEIKQIIKPQVTPARERAIITD